MTGAKQKYLAGCSKSSPARPQRVKARGVPLGYVEGLNDARTKLAGFFSILLVSVAKGGERLTCGSPVRAGRFKPLGHVVEGRNQFVNCGSPVPLLLSFVE